MPREVAYEEAVSHPALLAPEVSTGVFRAGPGGRLVREQRRPVEAVSEIGEDFITERRGDEIALLPIPDELAPFIATLRAMMAGGLGALAGDFDLALSTRAEGWRVALSPREGDRRRRLAIEGCGARVDLLEIAGPGGEVRRIRLGPDAVP